MQKHSKAASSETSSPCKDVSNCTLLDAAQWTANLVVFGYLLPSYSYQEYLNPTMLVFYSSWAIWLLTNNTVQDEIIESILLAGAAWLQIHQKHQQMKWMLALRRSMLLKQHPPTSLWWGEMNVFAISIYCASVQKWNKAKTRSRW